MTVVLPVLRTEVSVGLDVKVRRLAGFYDDLLKIVRDIFGFVFGFAGFLLSGLAISWVGNAWGFWAGLSVSVPVVALLVWKAAPLVAKRVFAGRKAYTREQAVKLARLLAAEGWFVSEEQAVYLLSFTQGTVRDAEGVEYFGNGVTFFPGSVRISLRLDDDVLVEEHAIARRGSEAEFALNQYRRKHEGVLSVEQEQAFVDGFMVRARR